MKPAPTHLQAPAGSDQGDRTTPMPTISQHKGPSPALTQLAEPGRSAAPSNFAIPDTTTPLDAVTAIPYTDILIRVPGSHSRPTLKVTHGSESINGDTHDLQAAATINQLEPLPSSRKRAPGAKEHDIPAKKQKTTIDAGDLIINFADYLDVEHAKNLAVDLMAAIKTLPACNDVVSGLLGYVNSHDFEEHEIDVDPDRTRVFIDSHSTSGDAGSLPPAARAKQSGRESINEGDGGEDRPVTVKEEPLNGQRGVSIDDDDRQRLRLTAMQAIAICQEDAVHSSSDVQLAADRLNEAVGSVSNEEDEATKSVGQSGVVSRKFPPQSIDNRNGVGEEKAQLTSHEQKAYDDDVPQLSTQRFGRTWRIEETDTRSVGYLDQMPEHTTANILPEGSKRASIARRMFGRTAGSDQTARKALRKLSESRAHPVSMSDVDKQAPEPKKCSSRKTVEASKVAECSSREPRRREINASMSDGRRRGRKANTAQMLDVEKASDQDNEDSGEEIEVYQQSRRKIGDATRKKSRRETRGAGS